MRQASKSEERAHSSSFQSKDIIMIMIEKLLLRLISSGLIGALHTLQLKEKFDKTLHIVYARMSSKS